MNSNGSRPVKGRTSVVFIRGETNRSNIRIILFDPRCSNFVSLFEYSSRHVRMRKSKWGPFRMEKRAAMNGKDGSSVWKMNGTDIADSKSLPEKEFRWSGSDTKSYVLQ